MLKHLLYKLKRPFHFIKTGLLNGLIAEIKHGFPAKKLQVITITGTDGKTTSSTMLYHVLKTAGKKVGLLSTVGAYIGNKSIDTGFHITSPQPSDLQAFMAELVKKKYQYLVLELTSHGSYQYRDWGITPLFSGITNVSHEHLDYHITYEEYLAAKAAILRKAQTAVVNQDDISYNLLQKQLRSTNLVTYSEENSLPRIVQQAIKQRFPENYNRMNARLVYALSKLIGISDEDYVKALQTFESIPGRMQKIPNRRRLNIIVDFAHTPQGVKSVLRSLKEQIKQQKTGGRLIAVLGAAGLRDYKKRPIMGGIASKYADLAIFTAEDPRTEDVWSIIRQMKEGISDTHSSIVSIAQRGEAIAFALETAKANDTICVLGKGHEKSMNYNGVEHDWNDVTVIEELLQGKQPPTLS